MSTVWVKDLDGVWEALGAGRHAGISPAGLRLDADRYGPRSMELQLARPPGEPHPDLAPETPVEVEVEGRRVWAGRLTTPAEVADGVDVTGEGAPAHLDDDLIERRWVHTNMDDWTDLRQFPGVQIGPAGVEAGQVQSGGGAILLGWPKGTDIGGPTVWVGVAIDLGPTGADISHIAVDYERPASATGWADMVLAARVGYTAASVAPFGLPYNSDQSAVTVASAYVGEYVTQPFPGEFVTQTAPAAGTLAGAVGLGGRFLSVLLQLDTSGGTFLQDRMIRLRGIRLFRNAAYQQANLSVLGADTVIRDIRDTALPLCSRSNERIATPARALTAGFVSDGPAQPRGLVDRLNDHHGYQIGIDADWRVVFEPKPAAPVFAVADPAALNPLAPASSEGLLNRVIVTGRSQDGLQLRAERRSTDLASARASIVAVNPDLTTDAAGWTLEQGPTGVRSTDSFSSAPASYRLDSAASAQPPVVRVDLQGATQPGKACVASIRIRPVNNFARVRLTIRHPTLDLPGDEATAAAANLVTGEWQTVRVYWRPPRGGPTPLIRIAVDLLRTDSGAVVCYVDEVRIRDADASVLDRRGTVRAQNLQVEAPTDLATMETLADLHLAQRATTPMRGTLHAAPGTVTRLASGDPVHPSELLRNVDQRILFGELIDTDTGHKGLIGTLTSASYDDTAETATADIDIERS